MEKTKHKRFKVIHSQGSLDVFRIIVDTETGVNYVHVANGYAGGLTPLLDKSGEIVVSPIIKQY